ncbi:MAG: sulfite exporter TauE/SafE family protein [Candidatus Levybacteria bacterium]|nr:sulfite exporter TauE/SafE family protein [Candidatus Levybacteria bacterium]
MTLWAIFLSGLFTGGLGCVAVQGGLLMTSISSRNKKNSIERTNNNKIIPIISFIGAKIFAYTILGFLLGWFGALFKLSLGVQVFLQFAVGFFMMGTALDLLRIHPIFRYFIIQPPRFLSRMIMNRSRSSDLFAPLILGFFTVFIPCGVTQVMMALSIASGSSLNGAAILFVFILGTSPTFFILGYFITKLGDSMQRQSMNMAAYAIIILAIFNINNAVALTGSSFTLEKIWKGFWCTFSFCKNSPTELSGQLDEEGRQIINIDIKASGYVPDNLNIKAGSRVKLSIKNIDGSGCAQVFTIPKLGIQRSIPIGISDNIYFTAPITLGELQFMCNAGIVRGRFNII